MDNKIFFDPYIYNDTVNQFLKYAYENNWISADYQLITDPWNNATDEMTFIKQLNQEDTFRLILAHSRRKILFWFACQ